MPHFERLLNRLPALGKTPIIGILRRCPPDRVVEVAGTANESGLPTIEITFDSEDPASQIRRTIKAFPEMTVGAGTVVEPQQAEVAIEAGASFVVSPVVSLDVLSVCLQADVPYLPGAATPTEIWNAYRSGATAVKVFPVRELGGPAYVAALRSPLEGIPLVVTGGVEIDDLAAYLAAGAAAVGLGGTLFPKALIADRQLSAISDLVSRAVDNSARSTGDR
ncbi:MAG: bifunctional 4-hydroxy-2-oxoglutarate aldolase/2-dehydro-3-deoxy-phosphogluconate aldolase [Acidimicrobiia bacterium]